MLLVPKCYNPADFKGKLMNFDLVILAGGRCDPHEWGSGFPPYKALLKLGPSTFLELALRAFSPLSGIKRRLVVGEGVEIGAIARSYDAAVIGTGNGMLANIRNVLIELESSGAPFLVISTSDMPFITEDATYSLVSEFERMSSKFDFIYPVVPVGLCTKLAPDLHRTSIKTREGKFTGGNVFLVHRRKLRENLPFLEKILANRKSPIKLAGLLGILPLFKIATGTGTLSTLEEMLNAKITGKVAALVMDNAQIAVDIDTPAQYAKIAAKVGIS